MAIKEEPVRIVFFYEDELDSTKIIYESNGELNREGSIVIDQKQQKVSFPIKGFREIVDYLISKGIPVSSNKSKDIRKPSLQLPVVIPSKSSKNEKEETSSQDVPPLSTLQE